MQAEYQQRREKLMAKIGNGTAIFRSAPMAVMHNDVEYTYRQDSDFFYLTGFNEPQAVAVLTPHYPEHRFVLFVQPKNREKEVWTGYLCGVDAAKEMYGADAVRLFILSDSPPEKDVKWSESGMNAAYKYIQKFWFLNEKVIDIFKREQFESNNRINIFVNQAIDKINYALDKFRYNIIIAVFHEIYGFFTKLLEEEKHFENLKENYIKILTVMMPVAPHLINECLHKVHSSNIVKWPEVEKEFIQSDKSNIVVQINGKKRAILEIDRGTEEQDIIKTINKNKLLEKYIENKKILKTIYVKDKIINIIIGS